MYSISCESVNPCYISDTCSPTLVLKRLSHQGYNNDIILIIFDVFAKYYFD